MTTQIKGDSVQTTNRDGSRYYTLDGQQYDSVTTTLQAAVNKPHLIGWAAGQAAEYVVVHERAKLIAELQAIEAAGPNEQEARAESLIDEIKQSRFTKRDAAGEIGREVHDYLEGLILERPMPPPSLLIRAHVESFEAWRELAEPEFIASELTVYNKTHGYAGTLDGIVRFNPGTSYKFPFGKKGTMRSTTIPGGTYVIDSKTSAKGPYSETALQLNAYGRAEFGVLPNGKRVELPKIDGAIALSIVPPHPAVAVLCAYDDDLFDLFLALKRIHTGWFQDRSRNVLGPKGS